MRCQHFSDARLVSVAPADLGYLACPSRYLSSSSLTHHPRACQSSHQDKVRPLICFQDTEAAGGRGVGGCRFDSQSLGRWLHAQDSDGASGWRRPFTMRRIRSSPFPNSQIHTPSCSALSLHFLYQFWGGEVGIMSPIRFPYGSAKPTGQMSDGTRDRKRHLREIMESLLPSAMERLGLEKKQKTNKTKFKKKNTKSRCCLFYFIYLLIICFTAKFITF